MRSRDPKLMMIKERIDALSLNEDDRQDLWICYLENPESNLSNNIEDIHFNNSVRDRIESNIIGLYMSTLKVGSVHDLFTQFTETERSVMILVLLGLNDEQISRYKMIGMLRLNQMLHNISLHPAWETLRDKEKTERRGEIWSDR
jgi:hypothetical protein